MPLPEQFQHTGRSESRLLASPLTLKLAAPFTELCDKDFPVVQAKEAQLCRDVARCEGAAWYANLTLVDIIDKLDKRQLHAVKQDRKHERYTFFFGKKKAHQVKRMPLQAKIDLLKTWIDPVKSSPFEDVAALGPELEQRVAAAQAAEDARKASAEKLSQFSSVGEGAALTTKLNAVRQMTHGKLKEMPYTLVSEGLPKTFADEFFVPVRKSKSKKSRTTEDIQADIQKEEQKLAALKQELDEANEEVATDMEAASHQVDLAEARKAVADAVARLKALEAMSKKAQKQKRRSRK
jgi:hypothetical protein